mmetsp:Transcript_2906/g.9839  ORF Transcript_2906/g.9839 Transcript_2906/m.9839 type:complete len:212 (-) Transcript_2906:1055-1690(-)|eukprot:scaffold1053_cov107-Isochrysis_galbana.AAC.10
MRRVGATTSRSRWRACLPSADPWCERSLPHAARVSDISDSATPSDGLAPECSALTLSACRRRSTLPDRPFTLCSSSSPCRRRRPLPLRLPAKALTPAGISSRAKVHCGVQTLSDNSSPRAPAPRGLRSTACRHVPIQPSRASPLSASPKCALSAGLTACGSSDRSKKCPFPTCSPRSVQPVGVRSMLASDGAVTDDRRPPDDATLDRRSIS